MGIYIHRGGIVIESNVTLREEIKDITKTEDDTTQIHPSVEYLYFISYDC